MVQAISGVGLAQRYQAATSAYQSIAMIDRAMITLTVFTVRPNTGVAYVNDSHYSPHTSAFIRHLDRHRVGSLIVAGEAVNSIRYGRLPGMRVICV